MQIRIINRSHHPLPVAATPLSAGLDLRANLETPLTLAPGERALVPTGLSIALPEGYEGQVRPRSGLALRHGITVLNSPGTIDADYRGELKVLLINHGGALCRARRRARGATCGGATRNGGLAAR